MKRVKRPELSKYKKVQGIYALFNEIDHKVYIGSTNCLYERICTHYYALRANSHSNEYLQRAYNKVGHDNITYYIVLAYDDIQVEDAKLRWMEDLIIDDYQSHKRSHGYNFMREGYKTRKHSESTKKKLSKYFSKPVVSYNIETGEVTEYSCSKKALGNNGASDTIKNKRVHKGSFWFYKECISIDEIKSAFHKKENRLPPGRQIMILDNSSGKYLLLKEVLEMLDVKASTFHGRRERGVYENRFETVKYDAVLYNR